MSRLVVVRRVDTLAEAIPFLSASVATVGVAPESRRLELRDAIAAAGVSNIMPLGECERAYAGIPHDGMRVLSELVNWTTG
jgi:acyl-CoA reductase LuxC